MPRLKNIIKIFTLFIILFSVSGCNTSYRNLNDLAIVSSFLVDTEGKDYKVYIELYKEEKSENKSKKVSYFVNGTGSNLRSAITDASNSVSKTLYFNHINAVIFSKDAINNNLDYMFNYLEKRIQVNSNYNILVTDDVKKLLKSEDEDNPILGEKVKYLIENSTNNGAMIDYDYLEKLSNFVSKNRDIYLSEISVKDKNITIENGYYFDDEKIVGELNSDEIKLGNLFRGAENVYFTFELDNKEYYVLKIDSSDFKFNFEDGIKLKFEIKANIDSAASEINLQDTDIIDKLNNHSSKSLERRFNELITKLKTDHSDIMAVNNYIYKYCGYQKYDFFKDDMEVKVDVVINKKGLVNNTIGGHNE